MPTALFLSELPEDPVGALEDLSGEVLGRLRELASADRHEDDAGENAPEPIFLTFSQPCERLCFG